MDWHLMVVDHGDVSYTEWKGGKTVRKAEMSGENVLGNMCRRNVRISSPQSTKVQVM